jgi:hypothetical protein
MNITWQRVRLWATNVVIGLLLALMFVQTFPGVPQWLSWRPRILADLTGTWQNSWGVFTPQPDNENHRLWAVIEYHDGHHAEWHSPEWSEQTHWQRFVGHRRSEYLDSIRDPFNTPALTGFAQWLAKTLREDATGPRRMKHVEIFAKYYNVDDPRIKGWQRRPATPVYANETMIFTEDYP